jgi:hypothetical protein
MSSFSLDAERTTGWRRAAFQALRLFSCFAQEGSGINESRPRGGYCGVSSLSFSRVAHTSGYMYASHASHYGGSLPVFTARRFDVPHT